ncbi:MAG: PPK2 family polyphosphate kinase [Chthoniobacterales bacterium]
MIPEPKKRTKRIAARSRTKGGLVSVRAGMKIRLTKIDPDATGAATKEKAEKQIKKLRERLGQLQQALYAERQRSLLIVLQAMDTGGKDGAIKNLCSGLDPNGVHLTNFKYPSAEEWDHDFLWRVHKAAPAKGIIGIWNRSHYEDLLVPRVHKQITEAAWRERLEDINAFERLLSRNGVTLLKFFLHISKDEQKERLEARLKDPEKLWKFNPGDLKECALWDNYQLAYEAVINQTATEFAAWQIVPANRKWSRNLATLETVVAALEEMEPKYPKPAFDPQSIRIE